MPVETSRQEKLEFAVRRILSDPDFPGCADSIRSVMALTGEEDSSFRRLSEVILKDVGLTLRILKSANSAYYNRTPKPIVSIGHAVVLLGMETVAMIAAAVRFIEHFARKNPGLRELVTFSLLTASQARLIAVEVGYSNPEEAYLCGLLRNLGEVLVAHYFPHEYAEIIVDVGEMKTAEKAACRTVLGFTYDTLAAGVLREWHIGGGVRSCVLTDVATLPPKPVRADDLLRLIATFSHLAATAVHRGDPEEAPAALRRLLRDHGAGVALDQLTLTKILDCAVTDTRNSFLSLGISVDSLKLREQARKAVSLLQETPDEEAESETRRSLQFFAQIEAAIESGEGFDLTAVVMMALEALASGRSFQRAIFALVNNDRSVLEGKLGYGTASREAVDAFRFPISIRGGPVGMAMLRKQDLLIDLAKEDTRTAGNLIDLLKPGLFGIYPIVVDGLSLGCIYVDHPESNRSVAEADLDCVKKLRSLMVLAVKRKRRGGH